MVNLSNCLGRVNKIVAKKKSFECFVQVTHCVIFHISSGSVERVLTMYMSSDIISNINIILLSPLNCYNYEVDVKTTVHIRGRYSVS